jgi:23S rRNA (guanosine2251-2'-O)-methyltransferase
MNGAELVYGRRAVREALRGPREVLELSASERALAAAGWLRDEPGLRVHVRPEKALTALAGTSDHQGVVARCDPYRYADAYELAARERPLLCVLDRVTDPRNLGAVCRSAEGAGAGIAIPEHGGALVSPAVCRASAGAVEHLPIARVRNLADFLREAKDAGAWVYGAESGAERLYWEPDYDGRVVLVLGSEGKGLRPRVRASCDALVSLPLGGRVASLNVSATAAVLLYEIVRQRTMS